MSAARLADALRQPFLQAAETVSGNQRIASSGTNRSAAVLVPLLVYEEHIEVLLTQRAAHLKAHPGQVSFPGGTAEPEDDTLMHTTLRETHEEVGIPATSIEVLGSLTPVQTTTGFEVLPFVGLVDPSASIIIDPDEVELAFKVPLDFFQQPGNRQDLQYTHQGQTISVVSFDYQGLEIWGVTAGILVALLSKLGNSLADSLVDKNQI